MTPGTAPEGAIEGKSEPRKCGAVKHGGITMFCTEDEGHDTGPDATWHRAVYTKHEDHAYPGAHHVINMIETVTWEPVDHIAEAVRHITSAKRSDDD